MKDPKDIKTLADLTPDGENFNRHTEFGQKLLEDSLRKFGAGRSILVDKDGNIIAGNSTTETAAAIGMEDVIVVPTDGKKLVVVQRTDLTLDSPEGRELALADNITALKGIDLDLAKVQETLGDDLAKAWGMELPKPEKVKPEKRDDVEEMLNEAMVENVREAFTQINQSLAHGWLLSGLTLGMCKAKFIRAKYYGEDYPRYLALYFTPSMYKTSAQKLSVYDGLKKIAEEKTTAGVAGLRTFTTDGNVTTTTTTTTTRGSYPFAASRLPLDFNANACRDLLQEFGGGRVLDPCHGWGGRLVGALLADVESYTGVDPSDEASAGVHKIAEAYHEYAPDTEVKLLKMPFEDTALEAGTYDIAITSPPYFDVEQYHGEQQSHVRYPKYDLWRDGFYRQLIAKVYDYLSDGGTFILQVGSQSYPLLEDGKKIAAEVGFRLLDVRPLGGMTSSALHGNTDEDEENEKIIILRKG